jgi:hypothetical protein
VPHLPAERARVNLMIEEGKVDHMVVPNPHAPLIDPQTHGVGNAVVFLRGVDRRRSRPWDLPPVRVELGEYRLQVRQGEYTSPFGFVRRGSSIDMMSTRPIFHTLHAEGAAFFTLAFPDPDQTRTRRLERQGIVALSSGAGYFWMRAFVFVDDHPYYARTDHSGHFTLPSVPPGEYDLVCWMPNWHEAGHERDPETCLITRLAFQPPVEEIQRIKVDGGSVPDPIHFRIGPEAFAR